MLRLLVLIIIISGVGTRGVPTADENAELGSKGIKADQKDHSSEHATLTDCKDCPKETDKANGKEEVPIDRKSDGDNEDAVEILLTTPKAKRSRIVKPSLTFHRINVHINRSRKKSRKISQNESNDKERHESRIRDSRHKKANLIKANDNTKNNEHKRRSKATTISSKHFEKGTAISQRSKSIESKEEIKLSPRGDTVRYVKPQSTTGYGRDTDLINDKSNQHINNKESTELGSKNNVDVKITDDDKKRSDAIKQEVEENVKTKNTNSIVVKNEVSTNIQKTNGKLEEKLANHVRNKKLKLTIEAKETGSNEDFSDKTFKSTDKDKTNVDQEIEIENAKYKSKVISEPKTDLGNISKRNRKGKKETKEKELKNDELEREDKEILLHISTEKPNDEKDSVNHVLGEKLKDRWSRKGLSQVPDVERLERRLHPTVDAPVKDIIRSMKNMLRLIQSSLSKVEKDFMMIQNTTRWNYMINVRNQLTQLANKNDEVYDVVMESSLLTKEIYRKAHEQKHPRSDIEAVAVAYRSRLNDNMHPKIRENFIAAQTELELSEKQIGQINSIKAQKDLFFDEEMRVHKLVRERLPMRTMHDLYRRADQTIRVLTAAQPLSRYGDKNRLYMHMRNDSNLNMRRAEELIVEGFDLLMHAKRVLLGNRRKVQDHSRLMRNRIPVDVMSDMTFDSGRMELYVASDVANHHANNLAETAAEIHMKFVPLMKKAKEVIANNSGLEYKKRLEQSLKEMKITVKRLVKALDEIRLVIGVEEITKDRCEAIFASTGRFAFDEDSPIDCDPYAPIESSGNDMDGSGDDDDTFVDMEANSTKLTIEHITQINASMDESLIDIDEPTPLNTIVDVDITNPKESFIDIETDLEEKFSNKANTSSSSVDIDITKPKHSSIDSGTTSGKTTESANNLPVDVDLRNHKNPSNGEISSNTIESTKMPTITDKTLTKQSNIKSGTSTPDSILLDVDDEDIAQELRRKMTKKIPVTTTTTPITTTEEKQTTTEESDIIFDPWGWFSDDNAVVIDSDYDDADLTAVVLNMTFNEHIRERLYNYSQGSKMLLDEAQKNKSKIDEISLTWQKVKKRFEHLENKTQNAKSLIIEWKANKPYFSAVHDRVIDVKKNIQLKKEVIETQCNDAVEVANKKLKEKKKEYKKRAKKAENAANPSDVNEAVTQVKVVIDNVREINRLKQLYPSPCNTLEKLDRKIRTNITELRQKIERAKLIASTLQVAVEVPKKEYLEFPITELPSESHPLTSQVQMMLKHTGSGGRIMSLHVGDSESLSLDVESDSLKVVQTIDGDESSQTLYEEQPADKWYRIQLQRFAASYNFTMFGEDGLLRKVGFPSSLASQRAFTPDLLPTTVRVGATGNELNACVLGFEMNGKRINMFDMAENKSLLTTCSSQGKWKEQQLLLDGSGYAAVKLSDIRSLRSLQSIKISFNPRSDGTVIYLQPERMSMLVDVYVEKGSLVVFVHYHGFETKLKSTVQVYSQNHVLEIKFTSRRTKQVNVILNGVSNIFKTAKGGKRKHQEDYENILIGGFREENSSIAGCIKSVEVNGDVIPFDNIYEAEGHNYGSCPETECVIFDANSTPIEMTKFSSVNMLHVSIARGSLGPVLQFSKQKEKFNIEISISTEGIHVEETVKDNSEDFSIDEDSEFIVVAIQDDPESNRIKVTIGDESEDFKYGKKGGWWGDDDKKAVDGPVSYSFSLAAPSEDSPEFLGKIQNLIIDGRPIELLKYVDSNKLGRCTVNPSTRVKDDKHSTSTGITCQ